MDPWTQLKHQLPVSEQVIYLNHAAVAPLPLASRLRMEEYLEETLKQHRIAASIGGGALRLSPHCYNTLDELAQVLDLLGHLARG